MAICPGQTAQGRETLSFIKGVRLLQHFCPAESTMLPTVVFLKPEERSLSGRVEMRIMLLS